MYYLMTHSTLNFIYGYVIRNMVKDHSDSCGHMGYSFWLAAWVLLYAPSTERIAHTMTFVTPIVEHWLEWEIAPWVHHEGSIRRPIAPWMKKQLSLLQNDVSACDHLKRAGTHLSCLPVDHLRVIQSFIIGSFIGSVFHWVIPMASLIVFYVAITINKMYCHPVVLVLFSMLHRF